MGTREVRRGQEWFARATAWLGQLDRLARRTLLREHKRAGWQSRVHDPPGRLRVGQRDRALSRDHWYPIVLKPQLQRSRRLDPFYY